MSIKIIKKILILSLFYFTFGVLNAEENLKSVGKFKDWESFVLLQDGNKTCFAQSIPIIRAPKKLKKYWKVQRLGKLCFVSRGK